MMPAVLFEFQGMRKLCEVGMGVSFVLIFHRFKKHTQWQLDLLFLEFIKSCFFFFSCRGFRFQILSPNGHNNAEY